MMTVRPLRLAFFIAIAALAMFAWWLSRASAGANALRLSSQKSSARTVMLVSPIMP
jgi:hypothetical protein